MEESKEKAAKSGILAVQWRRRKRRKHESCVVAGFTQLREVTCTMERWNFPAWKSNVVKWGPSGRYPMYSACECGGYVIPMVSRVGPIQTRIMGWAGPDQHPGPTPRVSRWVTQLFTPFTSQRTKVLYSVTLFNLFNHFFLYITSFFMYLFFKK